MKLKFIVKLYHQNALKMKCNVLFAGLLFLTLSASPTGLFAQGPNAFVIDGRLKNMEAGAGMIYMIYQKGGAAIVDSAKVSNGQYQLKGEVEKSQPVALMDVRPSSSTPPFRDIAYIYLSADSFRISHVDSFSSITVKGPEADAGYQRLTAMLKQFSEKEMAVIPRFATAQAAGDTAAIDSLKSQYFNAEIGKRMTYGLFAKSNPNSAIALYALQIFVGDEIVDVTNVRSMFDALSDAVKNSREGKDFGEKLTIAENTQVGKEAMDFKENDTLGRPVSLSSFRGKYVLLDFWASWCGPCRMENPNVVKVYEEFHGKGFDILGVSLDKSADKAKWLKAIQDDRLSWTQVSDLGFWNNAAAKEYGVTAIPMNFLIDPRGKIIGRNLRGEDLEKKLGELFGE
jgi:peroxiredoxin